MNQRHALKKHTMEASTGHALLASGYPPTSLSFHLTKAFSVRDNYAVTDCQIKVIMLYPLFSLFELPLSVASFRTPVVSVLWSKFSQEKTSLQITFLKFCF